ncbi:monocarboxylate transporter 14-like isoform X2 [Haemaphysalis longicornis]
MARRDAPLRADPYFGIDSTWSWVTAAFLSWVICMAMVGQQAVGVLFYGIVDTFGVSRQQASWPIVTSSSLISLAGPAMGYLCRRFSCRSVLIVSTITSGTAASVCWFARSILFLTIVYGVIHGLAVSGAFVAVNVLASQHFERRRTTACSMIFTASGAGMLLVPPLAEYFRVTYGVRGTFLLLGGVILNALPAVIIIKSPVWMQRTPASSGNQDLEHTIRTNAIQTQAALPMNAVEVEMISNSGETEMTLRSSCKVSKAKREFLKFRSRNMLPLWMRSSSSKKSNESVTSQLNSVAVARYFLTIEFAVNAISFSAIILGLTTFMLVSVDIATDRGITPSRAIFLLNAFAASDIVCRPISGVIIDSGFLTLETVMLAGYVLQALAFELFVWSSTFPMMLVSSALIGVSNGSRIFLQAPVLVRDFGIDLLPLTMGGMAFCIGLVGLTRPVLVGYFRDHHGSYDGLLHILAVINGVLVVTWAVRLVVRKRKEHSFKEKLKKTASTFS